MTRQVGLSPFGVVGESGLGVVLSLLSISGTHTGQHGQQHENLSLLHSFILDDV